MKLSNRQILLANVPLNGLLKQSLPAPASFRLAKVIQAVKPILDAYEKARAEVLDRHAKKDETGKKVEINDGAAYDIADKAAFDAEMKTLLDEETEITIEPIKADSLGSVELPPAVFITLDWLFS